MHIQKIPKFRWLLLLLFNTIGPATLHAQYDNTWVVDIFNGCPPPRYRATVDFNSGSLVYNSVSVINSFYPDNIIGWDLDSLGVAIATMCNSAGQLMFYTDGKHVWDRNHNLMPNGYGLIDFNDNWTACRADEGSTAIVQVPFQPQRYYIFSLRIKGVNGGWNYDNRRYRLTYSIVDMSMNGGLGDVVADQKGIFLDSVSCKITVVKGEDCRTAWLVTFSQEPKGINAYEITTGGLNTTPVFSPVGTLNLYVGGNNSSLVASPDGHKLAQSNMKHMGTPLSMGLETYDFDLLTGQASNDNVLSPYLFGEIAFSPDNTKLYAMLLISGPSYLLQQYDLTAPNPAAAVTLLGATSGYSGMKLAPDGKIYFFQGVGPLNVQTLKIACIEQPNLAGAACAYNPEVGSINEPGFALLSTGNYSTLSVASIDPVVAFSYDSLLTAHDVGPVCFSDTFKLTAQETGGWDYAWNTGGNDTSLTVTGSGDYYVTYFTSCRLHTDTFHVTILGGQLPELHAEAGCRGDSNARVRATPAPGDATEYSYTWYHNGQLIQGPDISAVGDTLANAQSGTTYHLLFQAPTGCAQGLDIAVPAADYEAAFQVDTIVCEGEAVQFSNASTPDITGYSWGFGDGTASDQASPVHTYTVPGVYTVQLIGSTGLPCYDTARQTIIVDPVLEGGFSVSRDSICTGESITISPWSDSGVLRMGWAFGDGSAFTRYDVQPFGHAFDVAGDLPVSLALGSRVCPDVIITDTVHVYPLPVVNLGPDTSLCLNGAPIYLQNQYTADEGTSSAVWSTGDTAEELKVVHPGVYSLTVKTEPIGCSNTDEVEVKKDCYIDIPNVFSPNGDGVNDYFFPRQLLSKRLTVFRMQVLNRWGQVVFEATSIEGRGWDGRFNNVDQPAGVYVYVVDVTIDDDRKEHYEGNVTLLR